VCIYHTIVAHSRTIYTSLATPPACTIYHSNRANLWRFNFANKNKMQTGLHVKCLLILFPDSWPILVKVYNIKFHKYLPSGSRADSCGKTNGQTDRERERERDRHDEGNTDAFRNNSNAPKNVWTLISVPHAQWHKSIISGNMSSVCMITTTLAILPIHIDVACRLFVSQLTLKTSAPMWKKKNLPSCLLR
jgi:hypothetical protein